MSKRKTGPWAESGSLVQKYVNVSVTYSVEAGLKISDLPLISNPSESAEYFRGLYSETELLLRESMYFMALNRSNRVLAVKEHSVGGISGTICDIRTIMLFLVSFCASGVILCHNHPSGSLRPSLEDIKLAKKFKEACRSMDICFLDSIILTQDGFHSMSSAGEI